MPTGPVAAMLEAGTSLYKAAKVIVLTSGTRAHLVQHDPKALEQLNDAMDAWEGATPANSEEKALRFRYKKVRKNVAAPDPHLDDVKEVAQELEAVAREAIEHLSRFWWAFDSKDSRAAMVRRLASAYQARLVAATCGTPDPHMTDRVNDEMMGVPEFDRRR